MSEYELLEIFTSFQGLLQGWVTAGYSGTVAYLVAAYMAGSKLTRWQVAVVSLVYILWSSLCGFSAYSNYSRMLELAAEVELLNPERALSVAPWSMWAMTGNGVVVMLASVTFMWDIRRRRAGSPQDG